MKELAELSKIIRSKESFLLVINRLTIGDYFIVKSIEKNKITDLSSFKVLESNDQYQFGFFNSRIKSYKSYESFLEMHSDFQSLFPSKEIKINRILNLLDINSLRQIVLDKNNTISNPVFLAAYEDVFFNFTLYI